MSAGRGDPNTRGNRPLFPSAGVPNSGSHNLVAPAAAGNTGSITSQVLFAPCSTSVPSTVQEVSSPQSARLSPISHATEQEDTPFCIRPSWNVPGSCTQVPINIIVFQRQLTGRGSRAQLPLSATTALTDVSEGAFTRLAGCNFLSLGRTSSIASGDMTMNSSQLATPDKYNSEHLRLNCLYDEASKTENGIETSQLRQVATAIFRDSYNDLESVIPAATRETRVQQSQESTTLLAESTTAENQSMQKRLKTQINQSEHTPLSTPTVPEEETLTQIEMQIASAEKTEFRNEETLPLKMKARKKKHRAKDIVCEVCGDTGYRQLLLCCRDCKRCAVHQYCLDKVVFDASLIEWFCYECLQRRGEVNCIRSLGQVSSERPLSHAHFGSPVHQLTIKRVESVRDAGPYSPNDGCEELFSCPGIEDIPSVRERSVDPINISGISQHDTTEASASSERSTECQKASSCRDGKTVKMAMASSSSKESEDTVSENVYLEYVLACRSYLSKAQKKRVLKLIQEIQPEFTIFISIMRRSNVQPPGPFLGITKEYAIAHFPDKTTNVTLETPGKSKKWHPIFYKRDESRKNMLMGRWLDFVRDNHVQEGDICLLLPTKDEIRYTFMIYVLHETTHSGGGAGFQRIGPWLGSSSAKMATGIHIEEEPTTGEHVSSEGDMQEISQEPLESRDSDDPFGPRYYVPCRNLLSRSQKRIVEERVRAIRSEVPICVAVMKNNNIGVAQRWMLELCSRFASVYLPTEGQTILLQCEGKAWEAKMMFHNGRRWFINGGWPSFARGNGLRVGDMCLFELKKKESTLTMAVHIIRKEQF